jgi:flagella basal body P-ring formation protein FlgA
MKHEHHPHPARSRPQALRWPVLAGVLLSMISAASLAQVPLASGAAATANDRAHLAQMARDWIEPALVNTLSEVPDNVLRPEILMGSLDSRLRLAPCARIEPYLPSGTRLWGRSRIGLRCIEGDVHWNVFVPVTVKAWGPAWVLKRPVPAGTMLTQDDADIAEIDWAEQSSNVLATPDSWVGQQAAFSLAPGQALRFNMVRPTPVFTRGSQVRVKSVGSGFHVVVSGQAMDEGIVGQAARVKLSSGKIITGTVRTGQVVEVRL